VDQLVIATRRPFEVGGLRLEAVSLNF